MFARQKKIKCLLTGCKHYGMLALNMLPTTKNLNSILNNAYYVYI